MTQKNNSNFNQGIVYSVTDGIVLISGMRNATAGDMLIIHGKTSKILGMVFNLDQDFVSAVLFGREEEIQEGSIAVRKETLFSIDVGLWMFGRVLNGLGEIIDTGVEHKKNILDVSGAIETRAPNIISRTPVNVPLMTGIKAVDALIPIGHGQRELIIGDRQTGKTTIAVDTILNQKQENIEALTVLKDITKITFSIYVAIGQRMASIAKVRDVLAEREIEKFTAIFAATASDAAPLQFIAPYAGCVLGEYVRDILYGRAFIIYDDLSKHAVAYRQMSLLLRRPPGREAYPGDVFYIHARLLERAAALDKKVGGGSLTALPVIETQYGDVSAYIPTNVISITDGQIFLETSLFFKGIRPAINVGLSVSRIGSAAQSKALKNIAGSLKLSLAQFREIEIFARLGSDLDENTQRLLTRGAILTKLLNQGANVPVSLAAQIFTIFAGVSGKIDPNYIKETRNYGKIASKHLNEDALLHMNNILEYFSNLKILKFQNNRNFVESFLGQKQFLNLLVDIYWIAMNNNLKKIDQKTIN
jgi:proton translocating ATP synthase F1 alpha subunit